MKANLQSKAYAAVSHFYGNKRAKRSGVLYIKHIDEGLEILTSLGATQVVKDAWCLHPLLQDDKDLITTLSSGYLQGQDPAAIVLAMEYRQWANAHLSHHDSKIPTWGPLEEVKQMLIADKMQNRKDFEMYILGGGIDRDDCRLSDYFKEWFGALGIDEGWYKTWICSVKKQH